MSTTTWQAPCRSMSSRARRSLGVGVAARPASTMIVSQKMLAVSASAIGRLALQRRALGQLRVVVGVAELVGEGLHAVEAAVEVEQHERSVAAERHAERAAALAGARLGVDPLARRPARSTSAASAGE